MNLEEIRQKLIEKLIHIDKLLDNVKQQQGNGTIGKRDEKIIGLCLLGTTREKIVENVFNYTRQKTNKKDKIYDNFAQAIADHLSKNIYPRIAELMGVNQEEIAANWTKILNFLLDPKNKYKLNPPPQLNADNFQSSFGNQFFILSGSKDIVDDQIDATNFYQRGLFYQAFFCFLSAWNREKESSGSGNPETLIYLNNCLIDRYQNTLEEREFKVYTLAVVVPFHHNQGKVATEILRGIAQIQSHINYYSYQQLPDLKYIEEFEEVFSTLNNNEQKILIKILIVNEPNNIHFPTNQTAERLCELSSELNIIAVLGHYSSEMTRQAIPIYANHGMVLLNFSSTSNELSKLPTAEQLSFYRLTTQDIIAATDLVNYLTTISTNSVPQNTSIIYNQNSSYSRSYKQTIEDALQENQGIFNHVDDYPSLGNNHNQIPQIRVNNVGASQFCTLAFLRGAESFGLSLLWVMLYGVNIIFLIPDGGIEPNSLNNTGFITKLNVNNCLIAGSATFYQENVINWIDELDKLGLIKQKTINIIACIPWHFNSNINGFNSNNYVAQNFCKLGRNLWGENNLTWRSATAFDAVLTVFRTLEQHPIQNHQELATNMDIFLKQNPTIIKGVTGEIQFQINGDRLNPPTEIVGINFNQNRQEWEWDIV